VNGQLRIEELRAVGTVLGLPGCACDDYALFDERRDLFTRAGAERLLAAFDALGLGGGSGFLRSVWGADLAPKPLSPEGKLKAALHLGADGAKLQLAAEKLQIPPAERQRLRSGLDLVHWFEVHRGVAGKIQLEAIAQLVLGGKLEPEDLAPESAVPKDKQEQDARPQEERVAELVEWMINVLGPHELEDLALQLGVLTDSSTRRDLIELRLRNGAFEEAYALRLLAAFTKLNMPTGVRLLCAAYREKLPPAPATAKHA
jgi:hypothetical protein